MHYYLEPLGRRIMYIYIINRYAHIHLYFKHLRTVCSHNLKERPMTFAAKTKVEQRRYVLFPLRFKVHRRMIQSPV